MGPAPGTGGRPTKEIDKRVFETMCRVFCTQADVCEAFGVGEETVRRWCKANYGDTFEGVYKSLEGRGRFSLRRAQYSAAVEKGNPTMLIWLGKQNLGQKDAAKEMTVDTKGADGSSMTVTFKVEGSDSDINI